MNLQLTDEKIEVQRVGDPRLNPFEFSEFKSDHVPL